MVSKKRVQGQMTGQSMAQNIRHPGMLKQRKMPSAMANLENEMIVEKDDQIVKRRRLSLSDLPWDTVGIIFDFTPSFFYKSFRLNRTFTRLINKRRKGLTFRDKTILPDILKQILCSNQTIKELRFLVPIQRLQIK